MKLFLSDFSESRLCLYHSHYTELNKLEQVQKIFLSEINNKTR